MNTIRVSTPQIESTPVSTLPKPPFDARHRSPYLLHEREKVHAQESSVRRLQQVETDVAFRQDVLTAVFGVYLAFGRISWRRQPWGTKGRRLASVGRGRSRRRAPKCPGLEAEWRKRRRQRGILDVIAKPWNVPIYLISYAGIFSGSYTCSPEAMYSQGICGLL